RRVQITKPPGRGSPAATPRLNGSAWNFGEAHTRPIGPRPASTARPPIPARSCRRLTKKRDMAGSEPRADADRRIAAAVDVDRAVGAGAAVDLAGGRERVGHDDVAVLVQQVADVEERIPAVSEGVAARQVGVPVLAEPRRGR